jgi:hypothetical protein
MKILKSKWTNEEYKVPEISYKTHFKRTKTVEAKIRRYEKNHTSYFLTTNALEDKKVKWIAKGNKFSYEGMEERVFNNNEELFIDSSGWVIQNGKFLSYHNNKSIHIKNLVPQLWTIKKRK